MKFAIVTFHVPHPQGSAAGRQLWALADAFQRDGHDLQGWCWGPGAATLSMPDWCEWSPQRGPQGPAAHLRTLMSPRAGSAGGGWQPAADDAVRWADDWASWPAVSRMGGIRVVTVHYDVATDAHVLGWTAARVQDWRAQRRAVRQSDVTWALSDDVSRRVDGTAVPATLPIPDQPLPLRAEPIALLFADWSWPANARALRALLQAWPTVRARVAGAELVIAGRGSAEVGTAAGVRVIGEVSSTLDAMSEAAVLAFPCPPTSGPKLKVLDALAAGLPVVTTPAGIEGLSVPPDAVAVADEHTYAEALAATLAGVDTRATMAQQARAAVLEQHAPAVAARARLARLT